MPDEGKPRSLGSEPPPESPHKKGFWKKPFTIIFGLIGIIASTSTVIALVQGWFDPAPTAEELAEESAKKLETIENKLNAKQEDTHLVNQVSRRVTELSDQYKRINVMLKDIRRLDKTLTAKSSNNKILTPEQQSLAQASQKKEREELLSLVEQTEKMAAEFVSSVEEDSTLEKVTSQDSQTARTKQKALAKASEVRSKILPELRRIREKHESGQ